MKKLIYCFLVFLCLISCKSESANIAKQLQQLNKELIERSYICAEMGYRYAIFGFSKKEMYEDLAKIIGEKPKENSMNQVKEKK